MPIYLEDDEFQCSQCQRIKDIEDSIRVGPRDDPKLICARCNTNNIGVLELLVNATA